MTKNGRSVTFLGLFGFIFLGPIAAGAAPGIWRASHTLKRDNRVVKDRLYARNNRDHQDYSFLNAVGAIWPADIKKSAAGYSASTGFLIDRCHVLTNMHVVYTDDIVINPSVGNSVAFAVGQTEGEANRGALQGLKFLLNGAVIAHGDAIIVDRLVHNPENDWALIRLAANVDDSITPMTIAAVDVAQLPKNLQLSIAGFPADRRERRGDRFDLKDLWGSDGRVVGVVWASTVGAVIESTIQATRGDSGGPLYGDFNGHKHIVIGMHQSIRGNGIDVSESTPNIQVLFTPGTLASISAAQALTPCQ
ncbi:MAG: trypsin-like serine peptidase [Steroidobacteraceae bacterium]